MKFPLTFFAAILFTTFCAMAQAGDIRTQQVKPIPEEYFTQHIGDFDNLRKAWLDPQTTPLDAGFKGFVFVDKNVGNLQIKAAEKFLEDEFERFCVYGGENVISSRSDEPYSFFRKTRTVQCSGSSKNFLAKIQINTAMSSLGPSLIIYIVPKKIEDDRINAAVELEKRKRSNGPTGVVTTDRGTYQFERFGTLERRYVAQIDGTPIEAIKAIEFQNGCCDLIATYRDGSTKTFNQASLTDKMSNTTEGPIMSMYGYAFVLKDANTGVTFQERFDGTSQSHNAKLPLYKLDERIRKIEFSEPNVWAAKSGGQLLDGRPYMKLASPLTSQSELQALIHQFEQNDPKNLIPAARKHLAELSAQMFATISKIGTHVCRTENGQTQQVVGSTMTEAGGYRNIYSKAKPILVSIGGYVEGVNGKRIKVTITSISKPRDDGASGIEFLNELPPRYTKGLFVWDEPYAWSPCD